MMRLPVLIAAEGAEWEAALVLALENGEQPVQVVRRCVDLVELLAVAISGQARVALVLIHTSLIAGAPRDPSVFGIHLDPVEAFVDADVMRVLEMVEQHYPGVGRSMLDIFFPGELWDEEKVRWTEYRKREKEIKAAEKMKRTQSVCLTSANPTTCTDAGQRTKPQVSKRRS